MMIKYRPGFFIMLQLLTVLRLTAQSFTPADSLRNLIHTAKDDSFKVFAFYHYGEMFELSNPDTAGFYYQQGLQLAKKLNYERGIASYASYAIVLLNNKGRYPEALELCKEALTQAEKTGNKRDMTISYINIANEWQYLGDIHTAADFYLKAAAMAADIREKRLERVALNNLASVFIEVKDYDKVTAYASKALATARTMNDSAGIASSLINLAIGKTKALQYASAAKDYEQVFAIGKSSADYILMLDALNGLGELYTAEKDFKQSIYYFKQELALATEKEAPLYVMYAQAGLSHAYRETGNATGAMEAIRAAIAIAGENGSALELKDYYLAASALYEDKSDFNQSLYYRKRYEWLNDSLLGEKSKTGIQLAEAKFQSEKKEQQLRLQQSVIREKNTLNYVLAAGMAALLLISLLIYRTLRQKRKLQQQKIAELEKEKMLLATQSILKGQEEERSRLAKDLHDGLGGLLSGVKLQLGSMKGNLILSADQGLLFNNALNKLDESISEMRRVAHNMMPEALIRLGLQPALQDYCDGLSELQPFTITTAFHGLEKRMEASAEAAVYRIVQELLNNAVKHAGATHILAQVMRQENSLTITVEDNGSGFDMANSKKGAGLQNIRSRVDYLQGQMDVQSVPGKGTSVHIDCIIANHE